MASPTYKLFVEAMVARRQIQCRYDGRPRVLSPIILGHAKGQEAALIYQSGGESSSRLPDWKCFYLSKVEEARLGDRAEPTAPPSTGGGNTCVADVDLDINPHSPYNPKRNLAALRASRERQRR